MKFIDYIKNTTKNLKRRKMRTFLTSFAVSIGTMLIILMVSLGVGVQKIVTDSVKANTPGNTINVSPYKEDTAVIKVTSAEDEEETKVKYTKIDDSAISKIKNLNNVDELSITSQVSMTSINIDGKSKNNAPIKGVDLKYSIFTKEKIDSVRIKEKNKDLNPISYGSIITKDDKNNVLIGEKLLDKLGISDYKSVIGKEITLTTQLPDSPGVPQIDPYVKKFKISGVISSKFTEGSSVIISMDDAKEFLSYGNLEKNYYDTKGPEAMEVTVKNLTDVASVSDEISKMGYGVTSIQTMISQIKSVFVIAQVVLSIIGMIVIFVASIGVINTMTMSIYERTRSIGILKALGASRKNIKWLFITESALIGFIGGILGLVFSLINQSILKVAIEAFLKTKGIKDIPQLFSNPLWLLWGSMFFAILISVLAGLYPASKAAKMNPVDSLKHE